jgi:DNA-binding NarL/FixJ family response regulator
VIRIAVAEDSYLIREGLRLLLATQEDLDLVASVGTLPELLHAVDEHAPDVVLTDIRMPPGNRDEGIQAAERLASSHPGLGAELRAADVRGNAANQAEAGIFAERITVAEVMARA